MRREKKMSEVVNKNNRSQASAELDVNGNESIIFYQPHPF